MIVSTLDDRPFVLGLQWAFASDKAELRRLLKREAAEAVVDVPTDDGLLYGQPGAGFQGASRLVGTPVAALVVAGLLRDALVHHPVDPERIWVCAVRDGLPLPGNDRICLPEEALQLVDSVLAYQPDMPQIGSLPGSASGLSELLLNAPASLLRRSALRRARNGSRRTLVLGLGVLAAAAAATAVFAPKTPAPAPRAPQVASAAMPQADVALLERVHAGKVQAAIEEGRARMLHQPPLAETAQDWIATVRSLPFAVAGYRPRQLECRPTDCQVNWDWSGGTYDDRALQRLPGDRLPAANPGEYTMRAQTRIALAQRAPQQLAPLQRATLDAALLTLSASLARYGARSDIGKADTPINVELPAPPPELQKVRSAPAARGQAVAAALRTAVIGHQGRVRVLVSGWSHAQAVFDVLAAYPLVPERAVVTLNSDNVNIQIEARYVVPNAQ